MCDLTSTVNPKMAETSLKTTRDSTADDEVFKEIATMTKAVEEVQSSNRFILRRLNELCTSQGKDPAACPLCKCQCSMGEDGKCDNLRELSAKVNKLEEKDGENQRWKNRVNETLDQVSSQLVNLVQLVKSVNNGPQQSVALSTTLSESAAKVLQQAVEDVKDSRKRDILHEGSPALVESQVASCVSVEHDKPASKPMKGDNVSADENATDMRAQSGQLAQAVVAEMSQTVTAGSDLTTGSSESKTSADVLKFTSDQGPTTPDRVSSDAAVSLDKKTPERRNKNDIVVSLKPPEGAELGVKDTLTAADTVKKESVPQPPVTVRFTEPRKQKTDASEQGEAGEIKLKSILKPNFSKAGTSSTSSKEQPSSVTAEPPSITPVTQKKYAESEAYWHLMGHVNQQKTQKETSKRGHIHTILCIDVSESMLKGKAWQQTKKFFYEYISGLEDVAIEHDVTEEHLALTTFGHETTVKQMLTNNFSEIRQAFANITLGGPTPMFGGLMMAVAAAGPSCVAVVNGIHVYTRFILITDGHVTETNLIAGPDTLDSTQYDAAREKVLKITSQIADNRMQIFCVPVGDNPDTELLNLMAAATRGKLLSPDDGRRQSRNLLLTLRAGSIGKDFLGTSMQDVMRDYLSSTMKDFSDVDMSQMMEILQENQSELEKGITIESNEFAMREVEGQDMPAIGTRVRRGPDWHWKEQDAGGGGTVVGHKENHWLWVEWDTNCHRNCYCYGHGGQYDVLVVDEPRLLNDIERIAVGCIVKRGPDWSKSDEDGGEGSTGVVAQFSEENKTVKVRWAHGKIGTYRFGQSDKYDLEISNPFEGIHTSSASTETAAVLPNVPTPKPTPDIPSSTSGAKPKKNKNKNLNV